ncbi:hypothetical protein K402DRAFT_252527 [Aulographum hederae CBS 113979]|uniref:Uncharacterized protein n=1 Tax=Aulographum hederae CBS 113979 TaxID=1176131 RepID=A0A6G1GJJ8_9PEZI|nr:hypothetical protein K402DRAFT_252527 [Aulographum hederae CBS 113979]
MHHHQKTLRWIQSKLSKMTPHHHQKMPMLKRMSLTVATESRNPLAQSGLQRPLESLNMDRPRPLVPRHNPRTPPKTLRPLHNLSTRLSRWSAVSHRAHPPPQCRRSPAPPASSTSKRPPNRRLRKTRHASPRSSERRTRRLKAFSGLLGWGKGEIRPGKGRTSGRRWRKGIESRESWDQQKG